MANNATIGSQVTAGTGMVMIAPKTASQTIQIGAGAVDNATTLGVTNTEIGNITASKLIIGNSVSTGSITLVGDIAAANVSKLSILSLNTGGNIAINKSIQATNALNIGLNSGNTITITPTSTTKAALQTTNGTVNLTANTINLGGTATQLAIKTGNGNVNLVANNATLGSQIVAGTGTVTIAPKTASQTIQIGAGAVDNTSTLGVTNTEIGNITADKVIIGSSTSTGGLTLVGSINDTDTVKLNTLELDSAGNIALGSNNLYVDKISAGRTGAKHSLILGEYGTNGTITQTASSTRAIGDHAIAAKNLTIISQKGAVTLLANNLIASNVNMSSQGGSMTFDASASYNISGVNLNGNGSSTTAGDLTLMGSGASQTAPITGVNTVSKLNNNFTSGGVELTNANNDFKNIFVDSAGGNILNFTSKGDINILGIDGGHKLPNDNGTTSPISDVGIGSVNGSITQTGRIVRVGTLQVGAPRNITLNNSENALVTFGAARAQNISYTGCLTCGPGLAIATAQDSQGNYIGNVTISVGAVESGSVLANKLTIKANAVSNGFANTIYLPGGAVNEVDFTTNSGSVGFTNSKSFKVDNINLNSDNAGPPGNLILKANTGTITIPDGAIKNVGTVNIYPR